MFAGRITKAQFESLIEKWKFVVLIAENFLGFEYIYFFILSFNLQQFEILDTVK